MLLIIINAIFGISILILAAYVYFAFFSQRWENVEGKILSISIQEQSHPIKRIGAPMFEITYAPSIKYEYIVRGKRYIGTRIRFSVINREYINESAMYDNLGFSEGDSINVYYFRYMPNVSVIKPNESEFSIYIMLILFIVAGMFAVRYYYNIL